MKYTDKAISVYRYRDTTPGAINPKKRTEISKVWSKFLAVHGGLMYVSTKLDIAPRSVWHWALRVTSPSNHYRRKIVAMAREKNVKSPVR